MVPELVLLVGLPSSLPCMDGMLVCVVVWCVLVQDGGLRTHCWVRVSRAMMRTYKLVV